MAGSAVARPVLRTPLTEDMPRAFNYLFRSNGIPHLYGAYAQTIWNFAVYNDYTLELDFVEDYRSLDILDKIRKGYYNLSLHGAAYIRNTTTIQSSYPVKSIKCCVMVPLDDEVPKFLYIIWPFGPYVWLTLLLAVFYVGFLMRYLSYFVGERRQSISYYLLRSIAVLFTPNNLDVNLQNRPFRVTIFYFLLFILVFILSSFHQSNMTAYCMKPVFYKPLNSVTDIQNAKLKLLVTENIFEEFVDRLHEHRELFENNLEVVSLETFLSKLNSFDYSVGYVVTPDLWQFVQKQQRMLYQPYFHLTEICLGGGIDGYPLRPNERLEEALNLHILAVQQAGLWNFWEQQAFDIAIMAGKARVMLDTYDVAPLTVENFKIGWIILFAGLLSSFFTLLFEHYWYKRQNKNKNLYFRRKIIVK